MQFFSIDQKVLNIIVTLIIAKYDLIPFTYLGISLIFKISKKNWTN